MSNFWGAVQITTSFLNWGLNMNYLRTYDKRGRLIEEKEYSNFQELILTDKYSYENNNISIINRYDKSGILWERIQYKYQDNSENYAVYCFDKSGDLKYTGRCIIDGNQIIENGMYACIYLDDFHQEIDYAKRLLDYCRMNNLIIYGDYICEVLSELSMFDHHERSMFLRLQVPVFFKK